MAPNTAEPRSPVKATHGVNRPDGGGSADVRFTLVGKNGVCIYGSLDADGYDDFEGVGPERHPAPRPVYDVRMGA